jgi:hypothetical protein
VNEAEQKRNKLENATEDFKHVRVAFKLGQALLVWLASIANQAFVLCSIWSLKTWFSYFTL